MMVQDLVINIAEAYIQERYPGQLETLRECAKIWRADAPVGVGGPTGHRFGPPEVIGGVVAPIVLGIVSNFVYEVLKARWRGDRNRVEISEVMIIVRNEKIVSKIRKKMRQSSNEKTIDEVIEYSISYLELHDE